MELELEPIVDNWYAHLDKGQEFKVVAVDEDNELIEIQYYDGDIEEISLKDWTSMPIELAEEPQDWAGVLDVTEPDDLGLDYTASLKEGWEDKVE